MDRWAKCELHMTILYELAKSSKIRSVAGQVTGHIWSVLSTLEEFDYILWELIISLTQWKKCKGLILKFVFALDTFRNDEKFKCNWKRKWQREQRAVILLAETLILQPDILYPGRKIPYIILYNFENIYENWQINRCLQNIYKVKYPRNLTTK